MGDQRLLNQPMDSRRTIGPPYGIERSSERQSMTHPEEGPREPRVPARQLLDRTAKRPPITPISSFIARVMTRGVLPACRLERGYLLLRSSRRAMHRIDRNHRDVATSQHPPGVAGRPTPSQQGPDKPSGS